MRSWAADLTTGGPLAGREGRDGPCGGGRVLRGGRPAMPPVSRPFRAAAKWGGLDPSGGGDRPANAILGGRFRPDRAGGGLAGKGRARRGRPLSEGRK